MNNGVNDEPRSIQTPISDREILGLRLGDQVLLSGVIITGRDMVHSWLADTFINGKRSPTEADLKTYQNIKPILDGGVIFHCGPIVGSGGSGEYKFISAGPTTSMRNETFQGDLMHHFNIKGVVGKGGMGEKTIQACKIVPSVYFHAIGGAGALIAKSVQRVIGVYKLEFGIPEAIWVIEIKNLPVAVTIDSHGNSLHKLIKDRSGSVLKSLFETIPNKY